MGYRSDVALAMYKTDYDKLIEFSKQRMDDDNDCVSLYDFITKYVDDIIPKKDNKIVILCWKWVKWYEEYYHIATLNEYLEDNDIDYTFVRIGEELDDNEEIRAKDDDLAWIVNIQRFIDVRGE